MAAHTQTGAHAARVLLDEMCILRSTNVVAWPAECAAPHAINLGLSTEACCYTHPVAGVSIPGLCFGKSMRLGTGTMSSEAREVTQTAPDDFPSILPATFPMRQSDRELGGPIVAQHLHCLFLVVNRHLHLHVRTWLKAAPTPDQHSRRILGPRNFAESMSYGTCLLLLTMRSSSIASSGPV